MKNLLTYPPKNRHELPPVPAANVDFNKLWPTLQNVIYYGKQQILALGKEIYGDQFQEKFGRDPEAVQIKAVKQHLKRLGDSDPSKPHHAAIKTESFDVSKVFRFVEEGEGNPWKVDPNEVDLTEQLIKVQYNQLVYLECLLARAVDLSALSGSGPSLNSRSTELHTYGDSLNPLMNMFNHICEEYPAFAVKMQAEDGTAIIRDAKLWYTVSEVTQTLKALLHHQKIGDVFSISHLLGEVTPGLDKMVLRAKTVIPQLTAVDLSATVVTAVTKISADLQQRIATLQAKLAPYQGESAEKPLELFEGGYAEQLSAFDAEIEALTAEHAAIHADFLAAHVRGASLPKNQFNKDQAPKAQLTSSVVDPDGKLHQSLSQISDDLVKAEQDIFALKSALLQCQTSNAAEELSAAQTEIARLQEQITAEEAKLPEAKAAAVKDGGLSEETLDSPDEFEAQFMALRDHAGRLRTIESALEKRDSNGEYTIPFSDKPTDPFSDKPTDPLHVDNLAALNLPGISKEWLTEQKATQDSYSDWNVGTAVDALWNYASTENTIKGQITDATYQFSAAVQTAYASAQKQRDPVVALNTLQETIASLQIELAEQQETETALQARLQQAQQAQQVEQQRQAAATKLAAQAEVAPEEETKTVPFFNTELGWKVLKSIYYILGVFALITLGGLIGMLVVASTTAALIGASFGLVLAGGTIGLMEYMGIGKPKADPTLALTGPEGEAEKTKGDTYTTLADGSLAPASALTAGADLTAADTGAALEGDLANAALAASSDQGQRGAVSLLADERPSLLTEGAAARVNLNPKHSGDGTNLLGAEASDQPKQSLVPPAGNSAETSIETPTP